MRKDGTALYVLLIIVLIVGVLLFGAVFNAIIFVIESMPLFLMKVLLAVGVAIVLYVMVGVLLPTPKKAGWGTRREFMASKDKSFSEWVAVPFYQKGNNTDAILRYSKYTIGAIVILVIIFV
jgi:hypothetical protein